MGRKLSLDQEKEIILEYNSGKSLSELGKSYDVVLQTIRHVLKRNDVVRRPRGPMIQRISEKTAKSMAKLWNKGYSVRAISVKFSMGHSRVQRALRFYGLLPEPRYMKGEDHVFWRGGRSTVEGYIIVRISFDSPFASMRSMTGYVMEHRLVMAESLGRCLLPVETVHHINGDKTDNRLKNLQLRSKKHGKHEAWKCLDCGSHNIIAVRLKGKS